MTKQRKGTRRGDGWAGVMERPAFVCLVLGLVTLAVFWPAKHFGFISLDDSNYVAANPVVQRGLTWDGVVWSFGVGHADNWHPLTWLSHMLDAQLFEAGPAGPHLVNVWLHVGNAILVFLLLRSWTQAHWRSALVAGLFALHPLHVESVAWISERKDLLSTLFWLLTLWAYGRYARGAGMSNQCSVISNQSCRAVTHSESGNQSSVISKRWAVRSGWYWGALGFFGLGLMSKPMVVTLPFVMLLLDFWPLGRVAGAMGRMGQPWRLAAEKIPFFMLSAASCVVTVVAQKNAVQSLTHFPVAVRIENAFVSCARYLGKMCWPVDLAIPYPPHPGHWPAAVTVLAIALVIGSCAAALWVGRKLPFAVTGWFWFLGTLVPVIGLVQVGIQSLADRYTYVPLLGAFIVVTWSAAESLTRWRAPKAAAGVAAAIALAACAARTRDQLPYWQNSESLFRHAIAVCPNNGLAHYSLGFYFFEQGRLEEAIEQYRHALHISPTAVDLLSDLGAALDAAGNTSEAIERLTEALGRAPENGLAHYRLGNALVKIGKSTEAIEEYRLSVRDKPDFIEARNNLAVALFKEKKVEEATQQFREIVRYQPTNANAHFNLGNALAAQPRWQEAAEQYTETLRLTPTSAEAHFGLARALVGLGRREEAVGHLREAVRLKPEYGPAKRLLQELGGG